MRRALRLAAYLPVGGTAPSIEASFTAAAHLERLTTEITHLSAANHALNKSRTYFTTNAALKKSEVQAEQEDEERALLSDADLKSALRTRTGGAISDKQLHYFKLACGTEIDGELTLTNGRVQEIDAALEDGQHPLSVTKLLTADSKAALAEYMLRKITHSLTDATKAALLKVMANTNREDTLMFLCRHMDVLQRPNADQTLLQLLDIYTLHRQPVSRSFEQGMGGAMHPAVSWSAMKPLHVEISHRTGMLIYLYGPQRVALGAFIDFSKVVRPLRAKNYTKRLKFKTLSDVYYTE